MYKFVKVEGYDEWYLLLDKTTRNLENFNFQERITRKVFNGIHQKDELSKGNTISKLIKVACDNIDYDELIKKYGSLLIRSIGSFMPLRGNKIVKKVYSKGFPLNKNKATIFVCENDAEAPYSWLKYLNSHYPDKEIEVINFFDTRDVGYLSEIFQYAEVITFSTTFTNMGWVQKLAKSANKKTPILGYSTNKKGWAKAIKILDGFDIEKVVKV